jgi:hypothetical protein
MNRRAGCDTLLARHQALVMGQPAHLPQPGQAISPVQYADEVPHDRLHCLITASHHYNNVVSGFLRRLRKWLRR